MAEIYTKGNGADISDDFPKNTAIPMPIKNLPHGNVFQGGTISRAAPNSKTMPPVKQNSNFLQLYGGIVIAVVLSVVPVIALFAVMQYRIGVLEERHEREFGALKAAIAAERAESNARIADAQAYGNSALSQSKFVQGILLGKGILTSNDITQIQSQK